MVLETQPAVARRIDGQAGRLVDHERLAVEEENVVGEHAPPLPPSSAACQSVIHAVGS